MELCDEFRAEYEGMLQEHVDIVKALETLDGATRKAKKRDVIQFVRMTSEASEPQDGLNTYWKKNKCGGQETKE